MKTCTIPALHPYQGTTLVRLLRPLQAGKRDVLLHAPCGSGKTLIVQALIAVLQHKVGVLDHLRTFIVTAPFDQVVDSWTSGVEPNDPSKVAVKLITFRKEGGPLKYKAENIERRKGKDSRTFWEGFWRDRNSKSEPLVIVANRAAVLTQNCMEALRAVCGEDALRSLMYVADEVHHHASMREGRESSGNKSGEIVDLLLARGATVLGSSATPYNTNGDVIRAGTVVVPLTYSEYQRQIDPRTITAECPEGKPVAPRRWELRSVETTYQTDDETIAVSKDVRVGNKETDAGASQGRLDFAMSCVPAFVRQWTENKCVYTAMRFGSVAACMAGERALLADKKVRRVLGRVPRVLNLGGTMTPEQKAEMFAALKHEAEIERYEDRRYDVVIGVNRLDEGTDVKLACDIFVTGLPRSASFFMQLLQRAGRGKAHIEGYPEDRQDTLRGYIFKPELTEESNERYAKDYSMSAGVLALFVASNDCVSLLNLGNTPRARSFGKRKGHTFADLTDKEQEDSVLEAEFQAAWHGDALQNSSEFFKIVRKVATRKDLSMGELGAMVREAANEAPAEQRDALIRGTMAHVCNGDPKLKAAWEATERRVFKKAASKGYTAMRLIQSDLAPEFFRFIKAHAGDIVPPLDRVLRDVVVIMGTTSEALAKSWSSCRQFQWPTTRVEMEALALEHGTLYKDAHAKWPSSHAGVCATFPVECTWDTINCRLRHFGSHLSEVFHRGLTFSSQTFTEQNVRDWVRKHAKAHLKAHGRLPTKCSGAVDGQPVTWAGADNALKRYTGTSLSVYLGRTPKTARMAEHAVAVAAFTKKHGHEPTRGSSDSEERRLASMLNLLRCRRHDAILLDVGLPLEKQGPTLLTLGAGGFPIIPALARNWRATTQSSSLDGEDAICVNTALHTACRTYSRGLYGAHDLCQVSSLARANAEIEHDCWRFTLKGAKKPDHRPWAAILASGDNKKIEKAERVAFLDWETPSGQMLDTSSKYGARRQATRRPWSPPTTQPEAGKPGSPRHL